MKTIAQIEQILDSDSRVIHAAKLLESLLRGPRKDEEVEESLTELVRSSAKLKEMQRDLLRAIRVRNTIAHDDGEYEPSESDKVMAANVLLNAARRLSPSPTRAVNASPTATQKVAPDRSAEISRALAAKDELLTGQYNSSRRQLLLGAAAFAVIAALVWIIPLSTEIRAVLCFMATLGAVALFAAWMNSTYPDLDEADYYRLPGAKGMNGRHRCIYCGHEAQPGRGIYRHSVYRSTKTLNDCSKCKRNLFVS